MNEISKHKKYETTGSNTMAYYAYIHTYVRTVTYTRHLIRVGGRNESVSGLRKRK